MSEKFNEIAKGSFLRVNEEGKTYWGQSEGGGGGGFVVTATIDKNGTGYADKTFEEVMEQIKAGNLVVLKTDGLPTNYVLTSYSHSEIEKNIMFSTTFGPNPQSVFVVTIMLCADNSITATMYTLTVTEMGG